MFQSKGSKLSSTVFAFSIRPTCRCLDRGLLLIWKQWDPWKLGLGRRIHLVIDSVRSSTTILRTPQGQGILQEKRLETGHGSIMPAVITSVPEPLPHCDDDVLKSCICTPGYQVHSRFKDTLLLCLLLVV